MSAYTQLADHFREISAIEGASAILGWDYEVMMPSGATDIRAEQLAALAGIAHAKLTDPSLGALLDKAKDETLDDWQAANLREITREWKHATALPADLVQALTRATTACEHAWRTARPANDFATFATHFEPVLKLVREAAIIKGEALGLHPYDALLDSYDPGMRRDIINPVFAELESFLPDFIQQVIDYQTARKPHTPMTDAIPVAKQEALGRQMMQALGFDFTQGRIDVSAHPFCGGVPGDIRLTTRYRESAFTESLYGVLHETGHALYEMGLPADWRYQPVGRARGMSLHESQSLLVEMQLCRGRDFLQFALPVIRDAFGVSGAMWEEENVYRALTRVERSLIRVNADEATYPLHVILRYKLEQALLSGDLPVADLPAAWDDGMEQSLGIRPDCVGNGCMQDVHWPGGSIGYFPTYTLGAMTAAQLFDAARKAIPELPAHIRQGDFTPLFDWLRTHVHGKASLLSTPELIAQATGGPLNGAIYKAHLSKRYLDQD